MNEAGSSRSRTESSTSTASLPRLAVYRAHPLAASPASSLGTVPESWTAVAPPTLHSAHDVDALEDGALAPPLHAPAVGKAKPVVYDAAGGAWTMGPYGVWEHAEVPAPPSQAQRDRRDRVDDELYQL